MVFRLGGLLLVACSLATASPFFGPNFNLFEDTSDTLHTSCSLFAGLVQLFPLNSPKIENVHFELRTPCKRTEFVISQTSQLRNSPNFDSKQKTAIIVNGWNSRVDDDYTERLTKAYLCRGGYNVIVVNTSDFLRTEYINSAYNTEKLGQFIAIGLKNLGIPGTDIHLLGHSLGAHIMGSAARHFTTETGGKIARITGFDPARPCFINTPVFKRLSVDDATFVDIIHSNPTETGTEEPIGHVDFYPGGLTATQIGCSSLDLLCSHVMSVDYYSESVYSGNENNFMASKCDDLNKLENRQCEGTKAPMGYAATEESKGIYFLEVNEKAPFGKDAKNDDYLKLEKCGVCTK